MPENETLVPRPGYANRWNGLRERIAGGETPDQAFPDIQQQFYTALRRVFREWNARGVAPQDLIRAAVNNPQLLQSLINQTWGHPFANLLRDALAGDPNPTLESVLRNFLGSAWEQVRDLLQIDCAEAPPSDTFLNNIHQMLERLLRALRNDQSKIPPRPPRTDPPPDIKDILDEDLPLA